MLFRSQAGEGATAGARPGGWWRRTSGVPSAGAARRLEEVVHRHLGLEISSPTAMGIGTGWGCSYAGHGLRAPPGAAGAAAVARRKRGK